MKEIKEFCKEIKAVKYFSHDEAALKALGVEYEIFATRDAACKAALSAALQCCMTTVCGDLDTPEEHRDYASQAWAIWQAGYGVLGKVENVFYLYKKP